MINKAIAHITEQMMKEQDNPAIVAIEEYMTSICLNEQIATKILTDGKTLKGALKALEDEGRKRKIGNCGCVPTDVAMEIMEKYYEISAEDKSAVKKNKIDVIDISDFM